MPHGQSRPDWQIIQGVAQLLSELTVVPARAATDAAKSNQSAKSRRESTVAVSSEPIRWDYLTVGELAAEIAERVPSYAGVTYDPSQRRVSLAIGDARSTRPSSTMAPTMRIPRVWVCPFPLWWRVAAQR